MNWRAVCPFRVKQKITLEVHKLCTCFSKHRKFRLNIQTGEVECLPVTSHLYQDFFGRYTLDIQWVKEDLAQSMQNYFLSFTKTLCTCKRNIKFVTVQKMFQSIRSLSQLSILIEQGFLITLQLDVKRNLSVFQRVTRQMLNRDFSLFAKLLLTFFSVNIPLPICSVNLNYTLTALQSKTDRHFLSLFG